jgi:hypothetical protein
MRMYYEVTNYAIVSRTMRLLTVMRLNREGGAVPLARENQRMHQAFLLVVK